MCNSVCASGLRQRLDDRVHSRSKCIEQMKQIMASTPGFDIVYDRGAYVLDVDVNDEVYVNGERRKFESDSGISFPSDTQRVLGTSLEPSTAGS